MTITWKHHRSILSKMAAQISEGVTKELVKPGSGEMPKAGDMITVHCTGSLVNPPKKFWRYYGLHCVEICEKNLLYDNFLFYRPSPAIKFEAAQRRQMH